MTMTWEEMWNYVVNGSPKPDVRMEKQIRNGKDYLRLNNVE